MIDDARIASVAREAALGSYSPYSKFRVGAVVVAHDDRMFSSANVENAAYPVSQCAEANAINYAVSQGVRSIRAVGVACIDSATLDQSYPCGRCRQIMSEFDVERIVVTNADVEFRVHDLDEILPYRFSL